MSLASVRSALNTAAAVALGATPTEWENKAATHVAGKHARVSFSASEPVLATMGSTGEYLYTGFLQILFYYPLDQGWSASDTDYANCVAAFKPSTPLSYSGQTVHVKACGQLAGFKSNDFWCVPVNVSWYAFTSQ